MSKYLKISYNDNVVVALTNLNKGEVVEGVTLLNDIKKGHKIAIKDINKNENVIKYGYPIGRALNDIKKGEHVHLHNVKTNLEDILSYDYQKIILVLTLLMIT